MLHGVIIDNMIEGGPAHKSNQLEQGDIVLKVDGRDVNEDTLPGMVIGADIPGSIVTLTVQKASQEVRVRTVRLKLCLHKPKTSYCVILIKGLLGVVALPLSYVR